MLLLSRYFDFFETASGNRGATFDLWENIYSPNGNTNDVATLQNHVDYPHAPSRHTVLRGFSNRDQSPGLDNYGGKIYGLFKIPKTGNYTFSFRSDDGGELYISPNKDPALAVSVYKTLHYSAAWVNVLSTRRELVKDTEIYLELLYKEGNGGDFGEIGASKLKNKIALII